MKAKVLSLLTLVVFPACVSRAPTDCELDKRAGQYPSSFCDEKDAKKDTPAPSVSGSRSLNPSRKPSIPIREEAQIARVWVADQKIDGGHWMQGTWIFVELEGSRWSGESLSSNENAASENQLGSNPRPMSETKPVSFPTPKEALPEKSSRGRQ
jgi:hypothetical protein